MQLLTAHMLDQQWGNASPDLIDGILKHQADVFARYEIATALRLAHFMAQCSVECMDGTVMEENLHYRTAKRLKQVWPKRFPTEALAKPFLHNPQGLANLVYNGRMGNRLNTNDGHDFRGRGLLQLTGRDAYKHLSTVMKLDLLATPDYVSHPEHCLEAAGAIWQWKLCNGPADQDDVAGVTRRINGGQTGLADRTSALREWRALLSA